MTRAATLLRILRRQGWDDLRIERAVTQDLLRPRTEPLPAVQAEFYNAVLSAVGTD